MRFEVGISGVAPEYREMIIDADNHQDAILRAGALVGKAMGRSRRGMTPARVHVLYVRPSDKPLKAQHEPAWSEVGSST